MKKFCFTVDDNIRFLKELTMGEYRSIFEHPYMAMYQRLHNKYGLKIQLNLFYEDDSFNLSKMTEIFREEWRVNSNWLKMSFHSKKENINPYINSSYEEVFTDCRNVHNEIIRFAGKDSLAKTTTIHYCKVSKEGLNALKNNGVQGLLGLYGTISTPRTSYQIRETEAKILREKKILYLDGMAYFGIDIVLNCFTKEEILEKLEKLKDSVKYFV